jgi:hypothetical protein
MWRIRPQPGVILIENNPTSPASLTIAVDVLRSDADAAGLVTLNARWEVLGREGSLVGAPRDAMIVKPGSGRDAEAVAATMSRAVANLSGEIAAGVGTVTATHNSGVETGAPSRARGV